MNQNTAIQKKDDADKTQMTYVPFGTNDPIKINLGITKNLICTKTKSGQVCSDRDALRFMALCAAQKLNPFTGDCFLVGYDKYDSESRTKTPIFSMITAHVAFLKRAETCDAYEGMESGVILVDDTGKITEREGDFVLPEENCVGGWAKVYRKGRKPTYRRLSISAMKPNYDTPFWSEDKAPGQIVKCAEADALRSTFPTLLGGLYHGGEIIDISSSREPATLPSNQLVETIKADQQQPEADHGNQPEAKAPSVEPKPNEELEAFVTGAGYDFGHFQRFVMRDNLIDGADSMESFRDVSDKDAKRLLRAKTGMVSGMEAIKKGGAA